MPGAFPSAGRSLAGLPFALLFAAGTALPASAGPVWLLEMLPESDRLLLAATLPASAGSMDPSPKSAEEGSASHSGRCDQRLEPDDEVFGVVVAGEPRAWALADLRMAGASVHDVVGGVHAEVLLDAGVPRVVEAGVEPEETSATSWKTWTALHPDTSLWRAPVVAEGEILRRPAEVRIVESHHYRTSIGCAMAQARMTSPDMEAPGLLVVSGSLENLAPSPVHHVVLRFELVDGAGRVVYRDEGFNRSAESLAAPKLPSDEELRPIDVGAGDTFRMIWLAEELPRFETARVSVARVY